MEWLRDMQQQWHMQPPPAPRQQKQPQQQPCVNPQQQQQQRCQQSQAAPPLAVDSHAAIQHGAPPPGGFAAQPRSQQPCQPPSGGVTLALPTAAMLQKRRPPWYTQHTSDPCLVQLLPGADAARVHYPAGSGTPTSGLRGGLQLRARPQLLPARDVLLRFSFATAPNFVWTRGGKLGGGLLVGHGAAAGYRHSGTAASARLVWGPAGSVMLYIYTMDGTRQDAEYSKVAQLGRGYGDKMFPNMFQVEKGVWNDAVLRVRLNTPGRADGVAGLGVNGRYRQYSKMVWRLHEATLVTELLMLTFFGGSWATPVATSIDFANFSLTKLE